MVEIKKIKSLVQWGTLFVETWVQINDFLFLPVQKCEWLLNYLIKKISGKTRTYQINNILSTEKRGIEG
jgi:hypothetical protein